MKVGTVVARRLVLVVTKVDLDAKLWDITTRWDLRYMHDRAAPLTGSLLKAGWRTSCSMALRVATARFLKPKGAGGSHRNDRHGPKEVKSPSEYTVQSKQNKQKKKELAVSGLEYPVSGRDWGKTNALTIPTKNCLRVHELKRLY